ncbi:ABC transporter ATP-binding protein [Levilactobacillus spicheri]|uniref:ATP-binding cassette domain-containing protein n=1 Tax=Levilactobacillus spicheri TaxID=216463 RepID=UPI0017808D16|nr:ABC transporter ATP-binding protein [Levilactobacillus spicheri]
MDQLITFDKVTKKYAQTVALNQVSLTIKSRELFVLVGPSGSGKTTLLKMINRLNEPTTGTVAIDDRDVQSIERQLLRRNVGYVLQSGALFPNMTVFQNATIPLETRGWSVADQHRKINDLLTRVGLDPEKFATRLPSELSGGEAQRVGIVRALAADPLIVLMDEPFSALDPLSKRQLQQLVLTLHHDLETTFVFVTHDMQEAVKLADRMAVIHDGQLQQVGTPAEILTTPKNEFVHNFFAGETLAQTYLQAVVETEPSVRQTGDVLDLKGTDTIFTWSQQLAQNPQLLIRVAGKLFSGATLIHYLATMRKGV